jgi:hypothetical protein
LLSFRLGFEGSGAADGAGSDSPRIFAHRRCWASFIRPRAAAGRRKGLGRTSQIYLKFPNQLHSVMRRTG